MVQSTGCHLCSTVTLRLLDRLDLCLQAPLRTLFQVDSYGDWENAKFHFVSWSI